MKKRLSIILMCLLALGGSSCSDKAQHRVYTAEDFSSFRITETSIKLDIYNRPVFTLSQLTPEQHKLLAAVLIDIRERDIALRQQTEDRLEERLGGSTVCLLYNEPELYEDNPALELNATNANGLDIISTYLTGPTSIAIPANLDGTLAPDYDISPFLTGEQKAILSKLWEAKLQARAKKAQQAQADQLTIPCQSNPCPPSYKKSSKNSSKE